MKLSPTLSLVWSCSLAFSVALAGSAICADAPPPAPAPAIPALPPRSTPVKVVLKLDDMTDARPQWHQVLDSVTRRGIKAGFGIICNSLESPKPGYIEFIKAAQAAGRIEFWCHGYDHKEWTQDGFHFMEFQGPTYDQQKEHLQKCQQLAKDKLGFAFASFGAPFNATDEKTAQVLRDDVPDFKVWMYGDTQFPMGKTVLMRYGDANIENPIFHPSTERLAAGMAKHGAAPYFVIQGHPPQWDPSRMAEFERMLDYLQSQHVDFVTPTELAATLPPPGSPGPLPPPTKLQPAAAPATAAAKAPLPAGKPVGENLIENGDFARGMENWTFQVMSGAKADSTIDEVDGKKALHVVVPEAAERRFYVQFVEKTGFPIVDGKSYTLSFRAKAKPDSKIVVVMPKVGGAFEALARQDNIPLTEAWTDQSFTIAPAHAADAAHLVISGLAAAAGEFWFTDISLKENQ